MIQGAVAPTARLGAPGLVWSHQQTPGRSGQAERSQLEAGSLRHRVRGHFIRPFTSKRPDWLGFRNKESSRKQMTGNRRLESGKPAGSSETLGGATAGAADGAERSALDVTDDRLLSGRLSQR